MVVTRGSSPLTHTGPVFSSASMRIERNFSIINGLPASPTRSWRKKIGPRDVSMITSAISTHKGAKPANTAIATTTSTRRLTVCCHAGMVDAHPITEYPLAAFDQLIQTNLRAAFATAQETCRRWQAAEKPGHLIFTTSWVQDVPWPEITPYTTSKAGMKAMMRGYARELAAHKIRANAVAPGIVAVGLAKRQWDTDPSYKARAQKAIPLGFMQPPETVAHAFLYLCSDMAAYMTGSVLLVDGGCSLYPMDE